jgi:diguanylate cyclase (GGDEF)-like protein
MDSSAVTAGDSDRLRVLIVDDDADGAEALAQVLRALGHDVDAVLDGLSALERFRQSYFDLAIVDLEMPGVDGIEVCRAIRAMQQDGYTYLLVHTGRDRSSVLPAMRAGADDFLQKPADLIDIEARLIVAGRVAALHRKIATRTQEMRSDSERAMRAARVDTLTGAGTRLQMNEDLESVFAHARRYDRAASLAILDVDWFKSLNDELGHLAGDEVLARIAAVIRGQLRDTDRFERYGGEEFVAILPEQSCVEAVVAIERVRHAVEAAGLARNPTPLGNVTTISAGIAELAPEDGSVLEWLARADGALYRAKKTGRNRVVVAK